MNFLTQMFGEGSEIQHYDPIDVLFNINPEIASIAYANRNKWLTPDIIPTVNNFRDRQSEEQIAILKSIVQKCEIDADERKNEVICLTMERIKKLEMGTMQFSELQNTTREHLRTQAFLDAQKLKYETSRAIVSAHVNGQVQISKQDAMARIEEAKVLKEAILIASSSIATSESHKADNEMSVAFQKIQTDFDIVRKKCVSRELIAKLDLFEKTFVKSIERDIAEIQSRSQTEQEALITMRHVFQSACTALGNGGRKLSGNINLNENDIKIQIEIE